MRDCGFKDKKYFVMLKLLVVVGIVALLIQNYFLSLNPQSHIVFKDAVIDSNTVLVALSRESVNIFIFFCRSKRIMLCV